MRALLAAMLLAMTPLAALAATPNEVAAARAMIIALYRPGIMGPDNDRNAPWSPEIRQWMRRNDASSIGEAGVFDAVPFCGCQDSEPSSRVISVTAVSTGPATVRVTAILRIGGSQRIIYDMRSLNGHWVIENLHSSMFPDFLGMLRREVPRQERSHR